METVKMKVYLLNKIVSNNKSLDMKEVIARK